MTTGIYQLTFNTDTYIGQARSIQDRYDQHCDKLAKGAAAVKMQQAFKGYFPDIEVLIECHEDYLNALEMYFITARRPTLNTVIPKTRTTEEMVILLDNKAVLTYPPATIIYNLIQTGKQLNETKRQLSTSQEALNNKLLHLRVKNELKEGKDENKQLVKDQKEVISNLTLEIDNIYKRSFFQRIFNSRV